ncbi:MAG: PilZ domain-containing protein [Proteobacteria bacterium]|nr:PilZ domain-containing protein [Pseudomonadota bacterium]
MSFEELFERLEMLQGRDKYTGQERRKFARLVYPPSKRPILKIKNCELEVIDVSERGMKLFNYMQHKLDYKILGTVFFPSGMSIEINGEIAWQYKNEIGLFNTRIPRFIIEEEIATLLKHYLKTKFF